jgi:phage recombination protein Bet
MTSQALTPIDGPAAAWERKLDLVKRTVANGASNDEFELFLHQARRTGLDPLSKQIYCIKRGDKATIQTGIDGYRLIAQRTGEYAGSDDAVFSYDNEYAAGLGLAATVTVWRFVQGQRCPFTATARMHEYKPERGAQMWERMPHTMLAKCAEALALRKAFPAELSGVYADTEMDQAGPVAADPDDLYPPEDTQPRPAPRPMPQRQAIPAQARTVESPTVARTMSGGSTATEPQVKAVFSYGRARHWDADKVTAECVERYGCPPEELTRAQASAFIDILKTAPDAE